MKTEEKSNKITAIPKLLDIIMVKGCTVTIDSMGCQKDIALKIVEKEGDYLLALQGNQGNLLDDVKEAFEQTKPAAIETHVTKPEKGHGRIEKRTCNVIRNIDWVCDATEWKNLHALVQIKSERTIITTGEKQTETRYYISSSRASALDMCNIVRSHWGIENKLHWSLDVSFNEDNSRKTAGFAAENFSTITK